MIFSLLVQSSPVAHPASRSAYLCARAAVDGGHTLYRVFFIGDGVPGPGFRLFPEQPEDQLVALLMQPVAGEQQVDESYFR